MRADTRSAFMDNDRLGLNKALYIRARGEGKYRGDRGISKIWRKPEKKKLQIGVSCLLV